MNTSFVCFEAVILPSSEGKHREIIVKLSSYPKPAEEDVISSLHPNYLASSLTFNEPLGVTQGG